MSIVVDGHCHVGIGFEYQQPVDELLRGMELHAVDRAVICPVDRYIAVENRQGNDFVLQAMRTHPDRFYAFATANPWYGEQAVEELDRALGAGARGVKLHPSLQGFLLCDELVYPLIDLAQQYQVPVYFHTGTPAFAQPMHVAELAQRFPAVNFIMGHMGSTDFWLDAVPAASLAANIYLDTSWSLPQKIHRAIAAVGPERVLFSTDSPLSTLNIELGCIGAADLAGDVRTKVMGENMLRLLGEGR